MQLSEWLKRANLSQKNFAQLLKVSPACVNHLIKGKRGPSLALIERIERATNGDVKFADWTRKERNGI